jgi:hypothetical protein
MNLYASFRETCSFALILVGSTCLAQFSNAQALSTGTITDPSFGGMKAFTVNIPAGWQFQGTVVRGPQCYPNSFATFRAYSRDGLTEIRLLPALDYRWSGQASPAIPMSWSVVISNKIEGLMPRADEDSEGPALNRSR